MKTGPTPTGTGKPGTLRWFDRLHALGIAGCVGAILLGGLLYLAFEAPLTTSLDAEAVRISADGDSQGLLPARHYLPASIAWLGRQVVTAATWALGFLLTVIGTLGLWKAGCQRSKLRDAAWAAAGLTFLAGAGMALL